MNNHALWLTLAIIGIILLLIGAFVATLHFLITVGVIVLVVAAILLVLKLVRGGSRRV
jgi:membrane-bound ClpP family serine protease